jgi:two-component system, chemotaxis family, protein-glutamate methylesterase/glutaminase
MASPIKVLVVDDSALVRKTMADVLGTDPEIQVIGTAPDPYAAARLMEQTAPDVITLDVEMPRMDGISFLRRIMAQHPIPVVICSTLTGRGTETYLNALEAGAVEIIQKPKLGTKQFLEEARVRICDAVKAAARADLKKVRSIKVAPKHTADAVIEAPVRTAAIKTTEKVVLVGASTGGTEALRILLEGMPMDCPAIAIVQHMPEQFTRAFADRLNGLCQITVKEAVDGDSMLRGQALIAPGNRHMLLKRSGARYYVEIKDGPLVSRHRPSVDVLFRSGARYAGANTIGVIMTGMGDDGAHGLKELHDCGALTIAQDESTCIVFGMPGEAIKLGAADEIVPLHFIGRRVISAAASG